MDVYGRSISPSELDALATRICLSPDRLYTELTIRGVEWYFAQDLPGDSAMIVIVRGRWRRSVYRAEPFSRWLERHAAAIEVQR